MVHFISKGSQYAVRALVRLARDPSQALTVRQIADAEGIPHHFLAKLVGRLVRTRLITALKGPGGGARLARPPEEIRVLEVIEAVEGPDYLTGCFLGLPLCDDEAPCPMHEDWRVIRERLRTQLGGITLAELAATIELRTPNTVPPAGGSA
jgi:Rrf2 family protein